MDPATLSDRDIILLSLQDKELFWEVFARYYDPIRRYLQRRAGVETGEELAAETFETAFSRRGSFNPNFLSARPWLYGIASNLLRHHVRSERKKVLAYARLPLPRDFDQDERLDDRVTALSLDSPLKSALLTLRLQDREVLWLFAVADLSYEEIAQALGIPDGTVRSRLNRVRAKFREDPILRGAARQLGLTPLDPVGRDDGRG